MCHCFGQLANPCKKKICKGSLAITCTGITSDFGVCPIIPFSLVYPLLSLFCPWLYLFCPRLYLFFPLAVSVLSWPIIVQDQSLERGATESDAETKQKTSRESRKAALRISHLLSRCPVVFTKICHYYCCPYCYCRYCHYYQCHKYYYCHCHYCHYYYCHY